MKASGTEKRKQITDYSNGWRIYWLWFV